MEINEFTEQFSLLEKYFGVELDENVTMEYYKSLKKIDYGKFKRICTYLRENYIAKQHAKFPFIGHFLETQAFVREEKKDEYEEIPYNKRATPGELHWFFLVLYEIKEWHDNKLVEYNKNSCLPVWPNTDGNIEWMDIEEWSRRGCPPTWSPILDHMQKGSIGPYKESIYRENPKSLENYYHEYYNKLVASRKKRTGGTK